MKASFYPILIILFFWSIIARAQTDTTQLHPKEKIKKGWNCEILPAISFDADLGFRYDGLINLYNYVKATDIPDIIIHFTARHLLTPKVAEYIVLPMIRISWSQECSLRSMWAISSTKPITFLDSMAMRRFTMPPERMIPNLRTFTNRSFLQVYE